MFSLTLRGGILTALALLTVAPAIPAQDIWNGTTDNNWNTLTNWSTGLIPTSGQTALFNNAGNGMTNITLGGLQQTPAGIQFDNSTGTLVSYTLGQGTGGSFAIATAGSSATGAISVTSSVATAETIRDPISFSVASPFITNASAGAVLNLGTSASPATITAASGTITFGFAASGTAAATTITVNDAITGAVNVVPTATGPGTVVFNSGASTYTGTTTLSGPNTTFLQIGASSNGPPGTFTAGPFGTGTLIASNSSNTNLQAINGNQTVANPFNLNVGFTVNNAATPFNLTFSGPITLTSTASRTATDNTFGQILSLGVSPNSSTITLGTTTNINLALNPGNLGGTSPALLVLNDTIQNPASPPAIPTTVSFNSNGNNTAQGIVQINGANTYTASTTLNGETSGSTIVGLTVEIGSSSTGSVGAITNGPFGAGTLIANGNNSSPPILEPFGADRTIFNAMTMTSGFFVANPVSTGQGADTSGPHNLTLAGPITLGATGRTLTNNLVSGVSLTLGSAAAPSTLTLGSTLLIQTQQTAAGAGSTIVNDAISGAGGLTVQNGAVVQLTNGGNSYAGPTLVISGTTGATPTAGPGATLLVNNSSGASGTGSGPVSVTGNAGSGGPAAVGTGGVLGGTGTISGLVTISTTAAATQGGIINPGPGGNAPGTLSVGSMQWNPYGRYVFTYNANNTAVGGTTNSLISGSGTLDLSNVSSGGPFDLNLSPVSFAATPTLQAYTIANFAGGIVGSGGSSSTAFTNGTDISSLFTLSGAYTSAPPMYAMVVAGTGGPSAQAIQLTFTPVPEPAFVLAACGGMAALVTWRRRAKLASAQARI